MFKKILVPLDGTAFGAAAVPLAATLAQTTNADLVLVRILARDTQADGDAAEYLDGVAAPLRAQGRSVQVIVAHGQVPEQIESETRKQGADLVVMATHGRAHLDRILHGSVAEHVLSHSPVPVVLLRQGTGTSERIRTIVVPMTATPGGAGALAVARDLARTAGASVVLVEVVTPLPRYGRGVYIEPHWEEEMRARAQGFLDRLAEKLRAEGVPAEGRARIGPISQSLADIADEVQPDLIVMGTHAATGPARAVLGSVADEVIRRTTHPVLLVRLPADEGEVMLDEAAAADVIAAAVDTERDAS